MNNKVKLSPEEKREHLVDAKKDFQKMQRKIAPFIKRRKFRRYSTAGKWREASSLYS